MAALMLCLRADTAAELESLGALMPPPLHLPTQQGARLRRIARGLYVHHRGPLPQVTRAVLDESGEPTGETEVVHAADDREHVCVAILPDVPHDDGAGGTVTLGAMLEQQSATLAPYVVPWPAQVARIAGASEWNPT